MTDWDEDPAEHWPPWDIDTQFAQLDWITPVFSLVETLWRVMQWASDWECRHIPETEYEYVEGGD